MDYWFTGWIDDPKFVINRVDSDTYSYSTDLIINIVYSDANPAIASDEFLYFKFKPHQ